MDRRCDYGAVCANCINDGVICQRRWCPVGDNCAADDEQQQQQQGEEDEPMELDG